VVQHHYPDVAAAHPIAHRGQDAGNSKPRLLAFYGALVERVARLTAEWMAAGFTHGVLNTDNMSLAGESFDYGPFAFLEHWDPHFTAAYFDHSGLYAYGQQPATTHHNLRLLQEPLAMLLPRAGLEARLERFAPAYHQHSRALVLRRLGLGPGPGVAEPAQAEELADPIPPTLQLLAAWPVGYGAFFSALAETVVRQGLPADPEQLAPFVPAAPEPPRDRWHAWRDSWWACGQARAAQPGGEAALLQGLQRWNPPELPVRPVIERIWAAIDEHDEWQPLADWLARVTVL
jgi:uncharacterized protein YdiU (UPF0061 family)